MKNALKKFAQYFAVLILVVVILVAASIPAARLERPSDLQPLNNGQPLAIDNVNLVTMVDGQLLVDRQLLIRNGVIERIEFAGTAVSDDYRRIDARGTYLMPGLFDMHVHAMDRKNLVLSLAYGVTSVRNMGGYPMHLRWKRELAKGHWLGSNLFSATPTMNGKKNANPLGEKIVTEPDKARQLVRRYHAQGRILEFLIY